jgi:xanthine dehydrogenase accessory factor
LIANTLDCAIDSVICRGCFVKELDELLAAYQIARRGGDPCLIATLVKVEGSSYRRVGARMLLTRSGGRTGTLSGGCLEAEIQKKAWWLTEQGPVVERYETSSEEGTDLPFGLGCRGTLHVLLKRVDEEDSAWLRRLEELREGRAYAALATALSGAALGTQLLFPASQQSREADSRICENRRHRISPRALAAAPAVDHLRRRR